MSSPEKAVNLYEEDEVIAWENAKAAVERELGENPREGEVLRELCRAYTGWDGGEQA
jgi:hypothetical protein